MLFFGGPGQNNDSDDDSDMEAPETSPSSTPVNSRNSSQFSGRNQTQSLTGLMNDLTINSPQQISSVPPQELNDDFMLYLQSLSID